MHFNKIIFSFLLFILSLSLCKAQNVTNFQINKISSLDISEIENSWNANVYSIEQIYPGSNSYRSFIHQQKLLRFGHDNLSPLPIQQSNKTDATNTNQAPVYTLGFEANRFGGIPNDNDIAISNDGMVVSVSNSLMNVYDENGLELKSVDLQDFADTLNLSSNSYDPKIIYDPNEDRFILVFLNGSDENATAIVTCFSQTNDPTQLWNIYSLPGNPFNNGAWSDFPMIAINEQDLFVTVNHIHSDSASWQTGFMQSVIWQVQKEEGYTGSTLNSVVHNNVNYNNQPIRNLRPVKGGASLKADEMYFLSNRNFDFVNDTFFVAKINQPLSENANPSVSVSAILANENYGLPPEAKQTTNTFLQTNDARPLGAFIENGQIHFVGNTVNENTNLAAIYHGKINTLAPSLSVDLTILSDSVLEYGYPNISFTGQTQWDEQAIISFNHTSIDSFAGVSAIFYSLSDGYSERMHLISGNANVNLISGNFERWGDYTGSQRKYNEAGTVWISGFKSFFGSTIQSRNQHNTFVAKLSSPDSLNTSISKIPLLESTLYPNPVSHNFYLQFNVSEKGNLKFQLYDVHGKLVKELLNEVVKQGENEFIFNTAHLKNGVYFLQVIDNNQQVIIHEKIIKE